MNKRFILTNLVCGLIGIAAAELWHKYGFEDLKFNPPYQRIQHNFLVGMIDKAYSDASGSDRVFQPEERRKMLDLLDIKSSINIRNRFDWNLPKTGIEATFYETSPDGKITVLGKIGWEKAARLYSEEWTKFYSHFRL